MGREVGSSVLSAMILSAGESTRMGSPKALLVDPEGRPFVVRIVRTLLAAGLGEVLVITGSQHEAIRTALKSDGLAASVRLIRNADPARGQLSSIWTGLDECGREAEGLLMTLVDV